MKADQTALHLTLSDLLKCGVGRVLGKPRSVVLNMTQNHIETHCKHLYMQLKLIYGSGRPI